MSEKMGDPRGLLLLLALQLNVVLEAEGVIGGFLKCPGPCMDPRDCKEIGGRILGYCVNEKACCDNRQNVWGTCGGTVSKIKTSHFRSPNYPLTSSGDLVCNFDLELSPSTSGIRIDFLDLKMDSLPFDPVEYAQSPYSLCDSDMMFIKGFKNWSPDPRCGNLTGYSILVEREEGQRLLSIVFIMSSLDYKWNIRLTEIYKMDLNRLDKIVYNQMSLKGQPGQSPAKPSLINMPFPRGPMMPPPLPPPGQSPMPFNRFSEQVLDDNPSVDGISDGLESEGPLPRIAGGENAEGNSIPWQVSIQSVGKGETSLCGESQNMSIHICGGSIIDPTTIITAAHCFYSPSRNPHPTADIRELKVVVGELDMCQSEEVAFTKEYSISAILLHFNYIATEIVNDLAILQLSQSIQFSHGVKPILVAKTDVNFSEVSPLLSGWGSYGVEENSSYPSSLQVTSNLNLLTPEDCTERQRAYLGFNLPESKLPGKYRGLSGKGICVRGKESKIEAGYGDSGGPLVALNIESDKKEPPQLIGIVSHMRPEIDLGTNESFHLDYFVKVSDYKDWIMMGMVPVAP